MTTSDESWSPKLREISDLERDDHYHLRAHHQAFYFGEYTARRGFAFSKTNSFITNLKKPTSTRGTAQWHHKERAIAQLGSSIFANLNKDVIGEMTVVPVPPSKPPGDPEYDDRMERVARAIGPAIDVRVLLETAQSRDAAHLSDDRPSPSKIEQGLRFRVEEIVDKPLGRYVFLIDDVITTGATYVACSRVLQQHAPESQIIGIFAARRAIENPFAGSP